MVLWACVVVAVGAQQTFGAPLSLQGSISSSLSYDNNIYLSETDPVGDLATTVSPRIDLAIDQRSIEGTISYQATGEWYRHRNSENRLSHQGEVQASFDAVKRLVPRLDLQFTGMYSRAGSLPGTSLSGVPAEPGGTVLLPRTETIRWGSTGMAGYPWTRRLDTRVNYQFTSTRYDTFNLADLSDVVGTTPALSVGTHDSNTHDVTLAVRYRLSPATALTVNPGWRTIRVETVETASQPTVNTTVTRRLTTGAEYSSGPLQTFQGQVGVTVVDDDRTYLVVNVGLERRWTRARLSVTAGQEIEAGGGVTDTASVAQRFGADVAQSFGLRSEVSFGLEMIRNTSLTETPPAASIRIVTYGAHVGATRRFFSWLTGRLDYSYFVQRSDGIDLDATRHVSTATVTANAPPWRSAP